MKIALLVVFLGGSMMPSVTFAQSAQGEGAAPRPGSPSQGSISQSNQNAVFTPSTPGTNTPLPKAGDPVIYSPTNNTTPSSQCGFTNIIACIKEGLTFVLSELSFAILTISAYILGLAGLLLKFVIDYTVVNMSVRIDAVGTIDVAWTAFRDLANMLFIFIILYIAIGTILNLGSVSTKKMLVNVIIIGLLINFSLFFTKIIIDASNIVTIGFYNNIMVSDTGAGGWGEFGLAGPFVDKMQVVGIYDKKVLTSLGSDYKNILLLGLGGGLIFLVAAFIFLAISFLFIGRFIILVFLMILSPVAFASVALPEDKYSKMWWNKLLDQCIFAPVFMALLWVSLQLIGGILPDTTDKPGFAKALVGTNPVESLPIVMNFIIIIAMLLFCLLVAKQLGAMGASTAINAGNKIKSWGQGKIRGAGAFGARVAINQTAGRAERYLNDKGMNEGLLSRGVLKATGLLTKQKLAGKSTQETEEAKEKAQEAHAVLVDKNLQKKNADKMEADRAQALPQVKIDLTNHTAAEQANKTTKETREADLVTAINTGTALSDTNFEKEKKDLTSLETDMRVNPAQYDTDANRQKKWEKKKKIEMTERLKEDIALAKVELEKSKINRKIAESKIRDIETGAGPSTKEEIAQLEDMRKERAVQLANKRFAGKKTEKAIDYLRGKTGEKDTSKTGQLIAELEKIS